MIGALATTRGPAWGVVLVAVLAPSGVAGAVDGGAASVDGGGRDQDAAATFAAAEAQRHLAEGNRLFREALYDQAIDEYHAAFALVPRNKFHFNIGVAEKMRGDNVRAASELDLFLEEPGDASADVRADAQQYLAELSDMVSTVWVRSVASGSSLSVDGRAISVVPARPIRLAPGRHVMLARGPGPTQTWTRTLDLVPGGSVTFAPELSPPAARPNASALVTTAPAPNTTPRRPPFYRRWWFWAATGATLVGIGFLTVIALRPPECRPEDGCYTLTRTMP